MKFNLLTAPRILPYRKMKLMVDADDDIDENKFFLKSIVKLLPSFIVIIYNK